MVAKNLLLGEREIDDAMRIFGASASIDRHRLTSSSDFCTRAGERQFYFENSRRDYARSTGRNGSGCDLPAALRAAAASSVGVRPGSVVRLRPVRTLRCQLCLRERPFDGHAFRYLTVAKEAVVKLLEDRTEETTLVANDASSFLRVLECRNTFWIVF